MKKIIKTNKADRYFFTVSAIFFLLANLMGFSASSSLRLKTAPIPPYVIVHGVVFALWILLYGIQAFLIATKNSKIHRIIGPLGGVILLTVFLSGFYTMFLKVPVNNDPISEVGRDIFTTSVALLFAILGMRSIKIPFRHKRYMFYAILILSSAGIARVPLFFGMEINIGLILFLLYIPAVLLIGYDYYIYGKVFRCDIACFLGMLSIMIVNMPFLWDNKIWASIVDFVVSFL